MLEAGENYNSPDSGNDTLDRQRRQRRALRRPGRRPALPAAPATTCSSPRSPACQGHSYDGGAGDDTVSYARSDAALRVDLGGSGGPAGCGNPDQVLGDNESLEGSDGPDVLIGDNGDNSFLGHLGADTFIGKGGNDFIDAADGQRDKAIDCGGGDDDVVKDGADPSLRLLSRPAGVRPLPGEALLADQRHEAAGADRLASSSSPRRRQQGQHVGLRAAAIGTTRRPPSASWASRAGGGAGAVAWTAIASNGRPLGQAAAAVADDAARRWRRRASASAARRPRGQRRRGARSLITSAREQREHAGRVAGAGADLEHPLVALELQRLADRGDDPGLGDRLLLRRSAGPSRRRRGGAARGHERLARHRRHRRQHPLVADPAAPQLPLDHPRPQRRRSRPRRRLRRCSCGASPGSSTVTRPRPERTTPARSRSARKRLTLSREVPASWARSAWFIRIVTSPPSARRGASSATQLREDAGDAAGHGLEGLARDPLVGGAQAADQGGDQLHARSPGGGPSSARTSPAGSASSSPSLSASTLAERTSPSSIASSPKISPGPSVARVIARPSECSRVTRKLPSRTM